jgi:hypothetical protein
VRTPKRRLVHVSALAALIFLVFAIGGWRIVPQLRRRSQSFADIAKVHADSERRYSELVANMQNPLFSHPLFGGVRGSVLDQCEKGLSYHRNLRRKYQFATWVPWLPVLPDPPLPETEIRIPSR